MLHKFPGAKTTITFLQNCIYEDDGLTDEMENTHEMCQKIELHDTEPDNDLPEYIPYCEIHDKDTDEETKFVVIFATKPTLSFLNQGNTLHIDVTYRLVNFMDVSQYRRMMKRPGHGTKCTLLDMKEDVI